jgi:hypothetical protein
VLKHIPSEAFLANQAHSEKRDAALHTCRQIIAGTYVWSGFQKINPGFAQHTFPWMIEPFIQSLPAAVKLWLHPLGFVMPFVELGTGIGLLTRKFRNFSVLVALAMHFGDPGQRWPMGPQLQQRCMALECSHGHICDTALRAGKGGQP